MELMKVASYEVPNKQKTIEVVHVILNEVVRVNSKKTKNKETVNSQYLQIYMLTLEHKYIRRDPIISFLVTSNYTLDFQSLNSRSKPFNIIDILKCACKSNFTFFETFLLFIKYLTKSIYSDH